jgi:hypothetical protein
VLDGHFELILANASHIKNVPGRKTGSDLGEARDRDLAMRGVTVGFWRSVGADA